MILAQLTYYSIESDSSASFFLSFTEKKYVDDEKEFEIRRVDEGEK